MLYLIYFYMGCGIMCSIQTYAEYRFGNHSNVPDNIKPLVTILNFFIWPISLYLGFKIFLDKEKNEEKFNKKILKQEQFTPIPITFKCISCNIKTYYMVPLCIDCEKTCEHTENDSFYLSKLENPHNPE